MSQQHGPCLGSNAHQVPEGHAEVHADHLFPMYDIKSIPHENQLELITTVLNPLKNINDFN